METLIKTGAQILFAFATLFFVIYSIIAIYSLTTFGRNKNITSSVSVAYSVVVIALVAWGLSALTKFD